MGQHLPLCYPAPGGNCGIRAGPNVSRNCNTPLEKAAFNGLCLSLLLRLFYFFVVPIIILHHCTPSEASSNIPASFRGSVVK